MRSSWMVLVLLTCSACAPYPAVSLGTPDPSPNPGPSAVSVSPGITAVASTPACVCPAGMATPTIGQPSTGPAEAICSCPAIIVPSKIPLTDDGSNRQTIPANGISLSDNGNTFYMQTGESFLLNLGMDIFDWTVAIDNQSVLSRVIGVMVIRGAQGIFRANGPGRAVLSATGDPLCRQSVPACEMPSLLFKITVIVQ